VVFGSIIIEIKAKTGIAEEHYAQTINYLAASKCKVGLILNFGEPSLVFKRVIL
jgi:GxxExxY protein